MRALLLLLPSMDFLEGTFPRPYCLQRLLLLLLRLRLSLLLLLLLLFLPLGLWLLLCRRMGPGQCCCRRPLTRR